MEEKKFPTPAMLKAREAWAKKPEEEKNAFMNKFEEELKRHFEGRRPIGIDWSQPDETADE